MPEIPLLSTLSTPAVHPFAIAIKQAKQQFEQVVGCDSDSVAYPFFYPTLFCRSIRSAAKGQMMSLVWTQLSAAGHIACYQSSIHSRQTNDCPEPPDYGEKMAPVLNNEMLASFVRIDECEKNKLKTWDDPEMAQAKQHDPMAMQLKQALHYSQSLAYDKLTNQTCQSAILAFERFTENRKTDAMVVVMDIDGTVMNNSPWMTGLCHKGRLSSQASLNRWAVSQQAEAINGVVDLVAAYRQKKVPVIWVSNRTPGLEPEGSGDEVRKATEAHLKKLGLFDDGDQILLKGDFSGKDATGKPDTHKRHRFDAIRRGEVISGRTEIVQMVGDALADIGIVDTEPFYNMDTDTWPENIKKEIGKQRILIPNPLFYRGWHKDLVRHWKVSGQPLLTRSVAMAARNRLELGAFFPGSTA